jgi:ADP-heptose:LPS heptosyltransferase
MLADAERIAVVRANGIGDYVLAEPALAALRRAAPSAHIVLVGAPWHHAHLQCRPSPVDEVVVAPWSEGVRVSPPGGREDPQELEAFFAAMQRREFDIAVQLHGGGRFSNPFTLALGARTTVGSRAADAPALDHWVPYQYWQHEVHRCLDVVALLGARPVRLRPHASVKGSDRTAAVQALAAAGLDPVAPTVVVHPGASDPRRRWPAERFAQVARLLREDLHAQVVVVGSGDERACVEAVARDVPGAVALGDTLDLDGLVGLLEGAALVVANDSGPRHLADALGTATVSVYWCGNVINAGPVSRDRHRLHISWTTACPVCGTPCVGEPFPPRCSHDVSFVSDVTAEAVGVSAAQVYAEEVRKGRWYGGERGTQRGSDRCSTASR